MKALALGFPTSVTTVKPSSQSCVATLFEKKEVRKGCDCPNDKLFPAHETYPGFKNPAFQFPPGFCPGLDDRCNESPTYVRGCCTCTIEPVEIEGEIIPNCTNFNLYPSGPVDSAHRELERQLQATTSLGGVELVNYDNYENVASALLSTKTPAAIEE